MAAPSVIVMYVWMYTYVASCKFRAILGGKIENVLTARKLECGLEAVEGRKDGGPRKLQAKIRECKPG